MINRTHLKKSGALVVSLFLFWAASFAQLKTGLWQGSLQLNDSTALPFTFLVRNEAKQYSVVFQNAEEKIETSEITLLGDSLFIRMPVFDSEFRLRMADTSMTGTWINHARTNKNTILFKARYCPDECEERHVFTSNAYFNMAGKWETTFSPGKDSTKALGIIRQDDPFRRITGTFLTETGDYRFLEGKLSEGRRFYLACFDGSHAFLFTGRMKGDSIMDGHFYSGTHWHEPWGAKKNEHFQLRDPESLTWLKPGFSSLNFSFKNTEGKMVSLSDVKYQGKVVIIQLMGTWCPNCMDETAFLAPLYKKYNPQGLEIIALAFERTAEFEKASENIARTRIRFDARYDFLITGKTGKDQAAQALPMLNKVMAFPTTIYVDRKGKVRKIYTGFNGPATGAAYEKFSLETTLFLEQLLAE